MMFCFFGFTQKTAYEMRISDWSSDVCSSDLLLDRMARVYGPQARERGLALRMVPSSQLIHSDPHLLERILGNLLCNAVRYTSEARILLGCRRYHGKLRIEVWDTGIGIPEEELRRIFEEFHQLDNPVRERRCGAGLGLAIVRRLANILGHEIGRAHVCTPANT